MITDTIVIYLRFIFVFTFSYEKLIFDVNKFLRFINHIYISIKYRLFFIIFFAARPCARTSEDLSVNIKFI